jgi:sarcosine oxidase subunit beta
MTPVAPDVIVIGGGVVGTSIAYHLSRRGVGVLVLERDTLGAGSTGKNAGGVRLQFSTEINVRLSQRSLERFERFADEMGVDPSFRQVGYLFLITERPDVEPFERSLELWARLGVPARRLTVAEVNAIFPQVRADDVLFATFCPKDGYLDPTSLLNGYAARARAHGARFREDARVAGIDVADGRVAAVRVGSERIPCGTVVNAAGAWSGEIARLVGIDLPVRPLRRHIFVTERVPGFEGEFPLTVEFATGLYMHRESGGVLLGMADPRDGPGFNESVNWEFLPDVVERALSRLPVLVRASIRSGWAGLYEDTPDKHPVIGPLGEIDGFLCAAGFSGHGVMHAPATGELIAELVCDDQASLDITPLRFERFARGELVPEHNVI